MSTLEREIEARLRKVVIQRGGMCLKWVCPGWSGVPDRIVLLPGGHIFFVETKRPKGGRYSPMQDKWRDWLVRLGFNYYRIKDTEQLAFFELILASMEG
jgi:hypothetical protein